MASSHPKDQIIERLKDVDNVLITVNANPSVDELAAALGITLVLDKLEKHATAVFSGAVPSALNFLKPEQTFENTVDSLRDFIISLDKEKADHLRYKVEGEMVKIFITPYKTTITDKDLEFSQGDYNVEMVLAVGVKDSAELDKALADHGRIMHDATVATISITEKESSLGTIHWYSGDASSYSEVLTTLAQQLRTDKNLIDEQIANSFLTGIVAATDRFSNSRTTSEVMTVAAQLMAEGANQQLIVTKLEEAAAKPDETEEKDQENDKDSDDGKSAKLYEDSKTKIKRDKDDSEDQPPKEESAAADGSLVISHTKRGDVDEVAERVASDKQDEAAKKAEQELEDSLAITRSQTAEIKPLAEQLAIESAAEDSQPTGPDEASPVQDSPEATLPAPKLEEPTFGGTLNATSEQAADDKRRAIEADRNKIIMTHGQPLEYVGNPPASVTNSPFTAAQATDNSEPPTVDPFVESSVAQQETPAQSKAPDLQPLTPDFAPSPSPDINQLPPLPELPPVPVTSTPVPQVDEAQAAVEAAIQAGPAQPVLPPMPPLPDFNSSPEGLPPLPPMPTDFSQLPPLPGVQTPDLAAEPRLEDIIAPPAGLPESDSTNQTSTPPADPNQFQIPS